MKYKRILSVVVLLITTQLACAALNPLNLVDNMDAQDLLDVLPDDIDPDAFLDALPEEFDLEELEPFVEDALPEFDSEDLPPLDSANLVSTSAAGITLWYDQNLLADVRSETVPAITEILVYETVHPDYALFTFPGLDGYLAVVPVAPQMELVPEAGESFQLLQNALAAQPESFDRCVPQVPLVYFYHDCNHQQFAANVRYMDFQNGSGLRFVSVYAIQDLAPVNNDYLVYLFEGFTSDGKYYLTAEFQIDNEMLAFAGDVIPEDVYTDLEGEIMREYFKSMEMALNEADFLYEPSLETIDRIIASFRVE